MTQPIIVNSSSSISIAYRNVEATLRFAEKLLQPVHNNELSISQRQQEELVRFVEAHANNLRTLTDESKATGTESSLPQLLGRQQELEEALQFIDQAFIGPRFLSRDQQFLEAADWVCVEGYCSYISESSGPIGPLVAIDPRRSPAVWEPGASLPLPSLFQRQPQQFDRVSAIDATTRQLAYFPVVCLPSTMARLPELYPLLSHEVGHAVDYSLEYSKKGLTQAITSELPGESKNIWSAWMREIVADTVGLILSGQGFAYALYNFVRFLNISETISDTSRYPGVSLRIAMLQAGLQQLSGEPPSVDLKLKPLDKPAQLLLDQFRSDIWPIVYRHCSEPLEKVIDWNVEHNNCNDLAAALLTSANGKLNLKWPAKLSFRLAPSVLAIAQQQATPAQLQSMDTLSVFRLMHAEISDEARPKWVRTSSSWKFPIEVLNSLRPTFVAADGCTKIPPTELMLRHECITFVGATNDKLVAQLREAKATQKEATGKEKSWQRLEIFFASAELLKSVERDPKVDLIAESRTVKADLLKILAEGIAVHWSIHEFDAPALFGAYWDADQPGGRIHVSSQLLGTDIKKCPASDYIWCDEVPPIHYEAYRKHLLKLRKNARTIAWGILANVVSSFNIKN